MLQPTFAAAYANMARRGEPGAIKWAQVFEPKRVLYVAWAAEHAITKGRWGDAFRLYHKSGRMRRGLSHHENPQDWWVSELRPCALKEDERKDPEHKRLSAEHKMLHDAAQVELLMRRGKLPREFSLVKRDFEVAAAELGKLEEQVSSAGETLLKAMPEAVENRIGWVYNRAIYVEPPPSLLPQRAVQARTDTAALQDEFSKKQPGIISLDAVLSSQALQSLRTFCQESTVWYDVKSKGYVGAYLDDGFASPLLFQVAEELRELLPAIFKDHKLIYAWAYKYAKGSEGIGIHADDAAVNVNLWITEDEERMQADDSLGGLVVYKTKADASWNFQEMNSHSFDSKAKAFRDTMTSDPKAAVRIPYRANRAVIFDSTLFHKTDKFDFKPTFTGRRVNLTMLFGTRTSRKST